ncbi:MAG: diguanylate cyclase [Gammaproteobacteria bacterium]
MKGFIYCGALMLLLGACSPSNNTLAPSADAGFLDLSDWNIRLEQPIELAGQWEFYPSQLLSPEQINELNTEPRVEQVPENWTAYDDALAVTGYATYRLRIRMPEDSGVIGLFLDGQGSSYQLWINGEIIATDGNVGTDLSGEVRSGQPQVVFLEPQEPRLELVMQISNFSHRSAGFRNPILMGNADSITMMERNTAIFQWVYLSLLLAIALYHYFLFSQRQDETFSLHFANLSLLVAIRVGFTGNNVLVSVLPFLSWEVALRIEYLTFFLVTPVFAALMRSIYPKDVDLWFLRATQVLAAAYSLYIFLVSTLAATYAIPSYQIVLLLEIAYFVYFLFRLFRNKREGRFYIGAATLVGLLGLFSEILFSRGIVSIGEVAPFGMVGFVFVQAIYLATRYSASFRRVEELSSLLEKNILDLKESETKYRTIFEDSKDVIFVADLSGEIEEISPACADLFGYTPEEIKAYRISLNSIGNKEDRSRFANLMGENNAVEDFEFELQHRDGRQIRAVMNASTRVNNEGKIVGIQGAVRDISDKVQAQEQRRRADKLELIAATDALTNAYTRRYFDDVAAREMARSARNLTPLSLVIFDIDHFKQINDCHGHLAGDKVLVALSRLCQENIRSTDVFCRFGGEEFIILMPETGLESAYQKTEVLRKRVNGKPLIEFNGQEIPVTFSAGVATWAGKETLEALIERADKALYRVKQEGRNRTLFAGDAEG